jgi:cell division protein FtsN
MQPNTVRNLTYAVVIAIVLGGLFLVYRTIYPVQTNPVAGLTMPGEPELDDNQGLDDQLEGDALLGETEQIDDISAMIDEADSKTVTQPEAAPKPTTKPETTPKPTAKPEAAPKPTAKPGTKTGVDGSTSGAKSTAAKDAKIAPKSVSVQAGVFQSKENADKLLASIKAAGVNSFEVKSSGRGYVVLGSYVNKTEAADAVNKLKAAGIQSFIK